MTKWGEKNGIEFITMSPEKAVEGLDVLRNGFFEDESFCSVVGVSTDREGQKELEELCLESARDGISVVAVDKQSGRVAGVCYNKYQKALEPGQKSFFEEFRDKCKTKTAVALINEMLWFDGLVDVYEKYGASCSVELMFLGTHRDFRKRGVAVGCLEASLAVARSLASAPGNLQPPSIATAIFTSPFSIRAGRALHFDELVHVPMQDKTFEGKPFSDYPIVGPDHPGSIVMVKRL